MTVADRRKDAPRSRARRARAFVVPIVLALTLAACGESPDKDAAAKPPPKPSVTVSTTRAEAKSLAREIRVSGAIAAWQEQSLGVELTGLRVSQVLVEVGANVRAGQTLLLLDRRSLDVALRQAEASVAQARAQQDVAGAAARRGASLLEQKLISTSNLEELRGAELRADAQLAGALAERDSARLRLSFGALRAPDAGVISARNVQPGQIVNAGTELLRLIRRGRLEWRAQVADNDLVQIKVGAPVSVRSPAGEEVTGKVRAVSPAVDATTRTALIYADLPKPTGLRAGMFAEGRIVLGEGKALVLPRAALVYRDGIAYAFLLEEGNRVRQRRVETGGRAGDDIEIRDGLVAGSTVVLRGAGFLNDGDVVKVAETPASTAQLTKEPAKR